MQVGTAMHPWMQNHHPKSPRGGKGFLWSVCFVFVFVFVFVREVSDVRNQKSLVIDTKTKSGPPVVIIGKGLG
jgi:hypothetical protein